MISNDIQDEGSFLFNSRSCSIELEDKVIMTGGSHYSDSKNKVHLYDEYGWIGDLPDLRHNREDHGCGYYMNTDNKMVDIIG